jgi:alkylation response protein AidB-like acyl-CoA dehydrogenase
MTTSPAAINQSYDLLDLNAEQQEIINRVAVLARENFAARAPRYDETATFPAEDFDDLFRAGLLAPWCRKSTAVSGLDHTPATSSLCG